LIFEGAPVCGAACAFFTFPDPLFFVLPILSLVGLLARASSSWPF
jgi:hypothetical protein